MFNPQLQQHLGTVTRTTTKEMECQQVQFKCESRTQWYYCHTLTMDTFLRPLLTRIPLLQSTTTSPSLVSWREHSATLTLLLIPLSAIFAGGIICGCDNYPTNLLSVTAVAVWPLLGVFVVIWTKWANSWTNQCDDDHRLRINTLLGSLEAPPLEPCHEKIQKSHANLVLRLVEAYVAWLETVHSVMETLRWATALRLGRSSAGAIMDRLEQSRNTGLGRNGKRLPGSRLRSILKRMLDLHKQSLKHLTNPASPPFSCSMDPTQVMGTQDDVVTLAMLRQTYGELCIVLSQTVQWLWQLQSLSRESVAVSSEIHETTKNVEEARAYLLAWTAPPDSSRETTTASKAHEKQFQEFQNTVDCLQEALKGFGILQYHQDDDGVEWETCRGIVRKLSIQYDYLDQQYSPNFVSENRGTYNYHDLPVQLNTTPSGRGDTVEQHEHVPLSTSSMQAGHEDSCPPMDPSVVMVFSGRGTFDHIPFQSKREPRDSSIIEEPDPFAEQNLLEELRRYLQAMPSKTELEIALDIEQESSLENIDGACAQSTVAFLPNTSSQPPERLGHGTGGTHVDPSSSLFLKELSDAVFTQHVSKREDTIIS